MPLYTWRSKKTGKTVEVLRTFGDYKIPPTEEEIISAGAKVEEIPADEVDSKEEDWERLISIPGPTNFWPSSGGPGKGNWGKR